MSSLGSKNRKKLFIKPGFQRKMMIIMILLVIIAVNLVGGLCFGLITNTLEEEFITGTRIEVVDNSQAEVLKQRIFEYIFPKVLVAELITVVLLLFLSLRLTHHIAGPVYRLEKNMYDLAKGNLDLKTVLRSKDEFTELADALNHLAETFRGKLSDISEKLALLDYTELTPEQKQVVEALKLLASTDAVEQDDSAQIPSEA